MSIKTYTQAVNEALEQCLAEDNSVVIIGEGVPDGVFGTTSHLQEKYPTRVFDSPISENAITGIAVGLAISGFRPVHIHQRCDFLTLAADQLINNSSKWYSIFGKPCPMVVTAVVGRGWGNGPTHTQNFAALLAAIPGLKVIAPTTSRDMKGMMVAAIRDNNPVLILEHRWLLNIEGKIPDSYYTVPLDKAKVVKEGQDITIVSISYATVESMRAAEILSAKFNINAEVIDLRSCSPIDYQTIEESLDKTERLVFVDIGCRQGSIGHEIVSNLSERQDFRSRVLGCKDYPQPTSWYLTEDYYPTVADIVNSCLGLCGVDKTYSEVIVDHDVPHKNYSITF